MDAMTSGILCETHARMNLAILQDSARCHAGQDGDCFWPECPQEANNRANYQQWCPLAGDPNEDE